MKIAYKITDKDNNSIFAGSSSCDYMDSFFVTGTRLHYKIGEWTLAPNEHFPIFLYNTKENAVRAYEPALISGKAKLHEVEVDKFVKCPDTLKNVSYSNTRFAMRVKLLN